jgi:CheY-like chemotaxis protein
MKHLHPFVQQVKLVDDDADACLLFEKALQKVDALFQFSCANSGEELLEDLEHNTPSILFLDLTLPGMSGMECLEAIKRNPAYRNIKVIVYSNSARMSDIAQAYERGADLFIVKPFSQSHLVNALEHVFKMEWNYESSVPTTYFINNQFVRFTQALTA